MGINTHNNMLDDGAIKSENEDLLGREVFAGRIAEAIKNYEFIKYTKRDNKKIDIDSSFVISLEGDWGSGKSSVINLMKKHFDKDKENKPTIIEFNPWLFPDIESLTQHFFNDLIGGLKKESCWNRYFGFLGGISKLMKKYAIVIDAFSKNSLKDSITTLGFILITIIGFTVPKIIDIFIDFFGETVFWIVTFIFVLFFIANVVSVVFNTFSSRRDTSDDIKNKLKEKLSKREKKLLIIIDDIDRLQPDEIKNIFRLIKSTADFPNVIYLLAFDRDSIIKSLDGELKIKAGDYLDKIIQLHFTIPMVTRTKLDEFVKEGINSVLKTLPESCNDFIDDKYRDDVFEAIFPFFNNLRDIRRFINGLSFNIQFIKSQETETIEVNPIDFIAMETIRHFTPDFYHIIRYKWDLLTLDPKLYWANILKLTMPLVDPAFAKNKKEEDFKELFSKLKSDDISGFSKYESELTNLLRHIFPEFADFSQQSSPHYDDDISNSNQLRICVPENFDIYFTLLPDSPERITSEELEKFLSIRNDRKKLELSLKKYSADRRLNLLLERLRHIAIKGKLNPDENKELFIVFCDLTDQIGFTIENNYDSNYSYYFFGIIANSLGSLNDDNDLFILLIEIANKSEGIKLFIDLYYRIKSDKFLKEIVKIDELKDIVLEKIQRKFDSKELLENYYLPEISQFWNNNEDNHKVLKCFSDIISDGNHLIKLLRAFRRNKLITKGNNISEEPYVEIETINSLNIKDTLKNRFENLDANAPLYRDNKELIDFYKEALKD